MQMETKIPAGKKYANVLRPLLKEERDALRAALRRDGLLTPLIRDQHGDLLDGYNREDLCAELGIERVYRTVHTDEPVAWIKSNQKARRNLNREEMRELIAEQIMDTPHLSNKAVAKVVGANDHTVAKVRDKLVTNGKIGNVVRFDTVGRVSKDKPRHSQLASVDQPAPSQQPDPVKQKKLEVAPSLTATESGRVSGIFDSIIHHFADDNKFHRMADIIGTLDPDGKFALTETMVQASIRGMKNHKNVHLETRPAAKNQKHYKFYRQDKTIGLSVLKAKFRPVIEYLKIEGQRPISHQSTVRFNEAAGVLIQLLRDLEAE